MEPNYEASLEFLRWWAAEGPWVLTAIDVERKGIETRTFRPAQAEEMRKWLEHHGQTRNIYFHVNPVLRDITKKATREDVKSLAWLHVDIDPRAGEDINEERKRALKLLLDPPGDLPKPSCIIFSGGGYQGFWRLKQPLEINGQEAAYEEAKRYNIQLEILFGADNCHNVDRIMRLPGTINRPDRKKREKGRTEALAELIEKHDDRVYPLDRFTPAPLVQSPGESGFVGGHPVRVSGNVERLKGVDDPRLDGVSDHAKVVIVQGHDPEDPTKFAKDGGTSLDRSKALFYVCCEMVRGGCDDDTIYAVITDPDFGISASVLDKGSMAEKYALRQISRAREHAIAPELRELNEKHAVVRNWNGKCRVIEEIWDQALQRYRLTKQSFEDFRNGYMHRTVEEPVGNNKTVRVPLGKWWLQHPHRRQYDSVLFAPGRETPGSYNLWRGFACDAKPGNCDKVLAHIRQVICGGNEEYYRYLLGWMASAVQHPDRPGYAAVVLRGKQGTGKSFFATQIFGSLFGRHFLHVSDPKHLVGSFNAHLRDCVVLFGDEAFYAGDKKHESVLKMLVTEDMLIIEPKGIDAEMSANCVHLIMASNEQWVVPAGLDDRRFFVLDVSEDHKEDTNYFRELREELNSGGREALLHYLMTYDLDGFDVRKVPKTKALQEQKLHSMDPYEEWWFNKLRTGQLLDHHSTWETEVATLDLQNDFITYARDFNLSRRGNATKLGQMLKRFLPGEYPRTEQRATPLEIKMPNGQTKQVKRPYFYLLPPLEECREFWDRSFGGPYDWSKPLDEAPIFDTPF